MNRPRCPDCGKELHIWSKGMLMWGCTSDSFNNGCDYHGPPLTMEEVRVYFPNDSGLLLRQGAILQL
jgi:hypothetical protein